MKTGMVILSAELFYPGILLVAEECTNSSSVRNPTIHALATVGSKTEQRNDRPRSLSAARAAMPHNAGTDSDPSGTIVPALGQNQLNSARPRVTEAYENEVVATIRERWFQLLAEHRVQLQMGQLQLSFTLCSNGRMTNLLAGQNQLSPFLSALCLKAVSDVAPFAPWPVKMNQEIGQTQRLVRVTFHCGEPIPAHAVDGIERHQSQLAIHLWDGWARHEEWARWVGSAPGDSLPVREYAGASVPEMPAPTGFSSHSALPNYVSSAAYSRAGRPPVANTAPTRHSMPDKGSGGGVKFSK